MSRHDDHQPELSFCLHLLAHFIQEGAGDFVLHLDAEPVCARLLLGAQGGRKELVLDVDVVLGVVDELKVAVLDRSVSDTCQIRVRRVSDACQMT